ncbi:hypothetical protein [Aeromicrobium wangtongii]|uniref:hypothetical protein n=1 Tax=Aeromicrobium wangtongii TaxID=2969247 RepID=UPI0020170409|nr:hypothetical protein [Aeromicrobium wangtongii]MCL3817326.1 hypothetical protein [Aeromicrobium wangtongii]
MFDGIPSINDGFISGVHIGLVVAAGLCIVIAALVMIAVREPKHHDVETIVEETLSVG